MAEATRTSTDVGQPRRRALLPWTVLLLGLAATFLVTRQVAASDEDRDRQTFVRQVQRQEDIIVSRVDTYIALLRATAALIVSDEGQTTVESFRRYESRISIRDNYPGILGLGFTRRIRPEEMSQVVQEMIRQGHQGFRIYPDHPRDEYHAIIFLEPLDRRNQVAIGYDMYSEPVRREAMSRARDQATAAMSGRVTLVQEIDAEKQPGFLIYLPVFRGDITPATVEERRELLLGFAYSPFRAWDLFDSISQEDRNRGASFAVFAGREAIPDERLFATDDWQEGARFTETRIVEIAGQPWRLEFASNGALEARLDDQGPVVVTAVLGLMLSILLASLVAVETRYRRAAEADRARLAEAVSKLQESEQELERRVEERTAQLLAANEQLQGFSYSVAHDLRQNIRTITATGRMALEDLPHADSEARAAMEEMVRAGNMLARLVDDLLEFAKLERQAPELEEIDLSAMAMSIAQEVCSRYAHGAGTAIEVQPGMRALGDPTLIRIVLDNLIDNACKYSAGVSEPRIVIGARDGAFFVADNGAGFDMAFSNKLFRPFERLHRDISIKGTGIGLANVKRIVEKHGGSVWAEGEPGKGATFYFTLPGAVAEPRAIEADLSVSESL
jgi:two-component system, OmpR family, sensor kinase